MLLLLLFVTGFITHTSNQEGGGLGGAEVPPSRFIINPPAVFKSLFISPSKIERLITISCFFFSVQYRLLCYCNNINRSRELRYIVLCYFKTYMV
jgi:hypothetical protein